MDEAARMKERTNTLTTRDRERRGDRAIVEPIYFEWHRELAIAEVITPWRHHLRNGESLLITRVDVMMRFSDSACWGGLIGAFLMHCGDDGYSQPYVSNISLFDSGSERVTHTSAEVRSPGASQSDYAELEIRGSYEYASECVVIVEGKKIRW